MTYTLYFAGFKLNAFWLIIPHYGLRLSYPARVPNPDYDVNAMWPGGTYEHRHGPGIEV